MDQPPATDAFHSLTSQDVLKLLGSSLSTGLSGDEAAARLDRYGPNQLPPPPRVSRLKLLLGQFRSILIIVLLVAALLNLAVWYLDDEGGLPYDTIVIMVIVLANATIGFFQEHKAERSLEKLREMTSPGATVIRDGSRRRISAHKLVPGDIMVLARGDKVPGDGRLAEVKSLEMDESPLTGESHTIHKAPAELAPETPLADRLNMVYTGTAVNDGRALAVVTATGGDTEMGHIASLIESVPSRETPLKQNLDQLGRRLAIIILLGSAVVTAAGLIVTGNKDWQGVLSLLLFGVALAVAAIPEGLPAVVTGALALGTQRIAHRKAIIRKLPAVETLGSTTAICSDKTGTLTMGEMTVREIVLWDGRVGLGGAGYHPEGEVEGEPDALDTAMVMAMSAVLCNDASIREDAEGRWFPVGTPTEAALITMAAKLGVSSSHIRDENSRLAEAPFTSQRKQMSVIVSSGGGGGVMHAKGAPEKLIPACTGALGSDGIISLTEDDRQRLLAAADEMAARSLRALAVASRQVDPGACDDVTSCEDELVFLGLAGIYDPPRPEAAASIDLCRRAGIDVYMITGDHLTTARAIAAELGISGSAPMIGPEVDRVSDEQLEELLENTRIFARVSPGHKMRIVAALQNRGHTVAVTGDGVNDAPALKQADIGVAMGRSGTDVAREAADMVLLDDNFATIVAAVEEGRGIFTNIRKFLGFLLSSNAGLALTLFLGVLFASPLGLVVEGRLILPLLAVQILWINLVTNGAPALALGVDPRDPEAMLAPPRPRSESVVNRQIVRLIVFVGAVAGIGGLLVLNAYYPGGFVTVRDDADINYARTMAFVVLTFFQLFDSFNFRDLAGSVLNRKLLANRWLLAALALSTLMMVAVVHLGPLQAAFHTRSLLPADWLIAAAVASAVLWAVELFKLIVRAGGRMPPR